MQKYSTSAGTPQRIASRKSRAPGTISGAMPSCGSAIGITLRNANISRPRPSDSHSAWRNSGPICAWRLAPSSCDTEAVRAIRVPIGIIIGSHSSAVPTVTEASVRVPWWPAITLSTKLIRPVETCPRTSGRASCAVVRSSRPRTEAGVEDENIARLWRSRRLRPRRQRRHRVAEAGHSTRCGR
ncbi:hypothetical protein NB689_003584 [Xanthomonas sacchari]|nr:hypothetical protein [Xanthomonas sacchari]